MTDSRTRPLRILHTEASRGWGGQELRILGETQGMRERGHEVWITAPADSPLLRRAVAAGLPTHQVAFRRPQALQDLWRVRRLLGDLSIDVLNCHSSWDSWVGGLAARGNVPRIPVVRTRHLSTPVDRGAASRLLYTRLADRVVTTGEPIRRQLVRDNGYPAERIVSVVTGVDLARLAPARPAAEVRAALGIPPEVPLIGTLSTLRSWKGHLDLLEALRALVRTRPVRGLIVGDGPYGEVIRERLRELELTGLVTLTGHREDVAELLATMDIFAFPSYANEGVPQAMLQAMALGRPVVGAAVGGIPEVVHDGETGLLVPPRDPAALAVALARVLDDPGGAAARAAAARALVEGTYTREIMLDRMEAVYRAVLAGC
jgi:glycosyltransferase involved in cell wall biosynthesis